MPSGNAGLTLREATAKGKLDQFAQEHPNKDPHPQGKGRFDVLMDAKTRGTHRQAPERKHKT